MGNTNCKRMEQLALAFSAAATLAGCGGGGGSSSEGSNNSSSYISWNGNANGDVVLDANNNQIMFAAADGHMIYGGNNYSNTIASNGGTISVNGVADGSVTLKASSTGQNVAVWQCQNGNIAALSGTGATLQVSCSTPSPSPSPSPAPAPPSSSPVTTMTGNADACVSSQLGPIGDLRFYNNCGTEIALAVDTGDGAGATVPYKIAAGDYYASDWIKGLSQSPITSVKFAACPSPYLPFNATLTNWWNGNGQFICGKY